MNDYPWFRLYNDVLDDPKVQRLTPLLFKQWINLLCLASEQEVRGTLPEVHEIAFRLRLEDEETTKILADLTTFRLLDQDGEKYSIHNWPKYQYSSDFSTLRVRKFRENQAGNVPETLHVTPMKRKRNVIDTDTEEIQKKPLVSAAPVKFRMKKDWQPDELDLEFAKEKGLRDIPEVVEDFRGYWMEKAEARAGWSRTFRMWVKREVEKQSYRNNGRYKPKSDSVIHVNPDAVY